VHRANHDTATVTQEQWVLNPSLQIRGTTSEGSPSAPVSLGSPRHLPMSGMEVSVLRTLGPESDFRYA
jgi:hypothetical protein